jgi:hypothetical protein
MSRLAIGAAALPLLALAALLDAAKASARSLGASLAGAGAFYSSLLGGES